MLLLSLRQQRRSGVKKVRRICCGLEEGAIGKRKNMIERERQWYLRRFALRMETGCVKSREERESEGICGRMCYVSCK